MSPLEETLDSPSSAGIRSIAKRMLDEWLESIPKLHTDDDEALHDYRVGLRKLRSWLRTFDEGGGRVQRQLSKLQEATGVARDGEVMTAWLEAEEQSPATAFALSQVQKGLEVDAKKLEAKTQRIAERLGPRLSRYTLEVPLGAPAKTVTPFSWAYAAAIKRAHHDLVESALTVGALEDEVMLHRVRIRAKRLRYALGPLKSWPEVEEALVILKKRQDVLGDLHDRHALAALVEGFVTSQPPAELAPGLAILLAAARQQGHQLHAEYLQHRQQNDMRLSGLIDVICDRLGKRMGLHVEIVPVG